MKNTDDFHCGGKLSRTTTNLTLHCQQDEWHTKEDTGKSIKNAVCIVVCQKAPLRLKGHRTVKKIKPIAIPIVELHWSKGRQVVSLV